MLLYILACATGESYDSGRIVEASAGNDVVVVELVCEESGSVVDQVVVGVPIATWYCSEGYDPTTGEPTSSCVSYALGAGDSDLTTWDQVSGVVHLTCVRSGLVELYSVPFAAP